MFLLGSESFYSDNSIGANGAFFVVAFDLDSLISLTWLQFKAPLKKAY